MSEYHGPPADALPLAVIPLAGPEYLSGRGADLRVRIVDATPPDSATLFIRRAAGDFYRGFPLRSAGAYEYAATIPAATMREGPSEYVVTVFRDGRAVTFPEGVERLPWSWDYHGHRSWKLDVTAATTPIVLFDPARDASRLAFTRIGDAGRRGLFRLGYSASGRQVFHLELPVTDNGSSPADYTASLVVRDRIVARQETINTATALVVKARGLGPRQTLHLTLMEDDGTSWTAALPLGAGWGDHSIPLASFQVGRGVLLPQGFPGEWSYWVGPASGRGGAGDRPRLERIERLQISLRREDGVSITPGNYGIEIEMVALSGSR
jgi:hypothetical protein